MSYPWTWLFVSGVKRARAAAFTLLVVGSQTLLAQSFLVANGKLVSYDGESLRKLVEPSAAANEKILHLHDSRAAGGHNRFLLSKRFDDRYIPDSDVPSGFDLWLRDDTGTERLVDSRAFRGKFAPDGQRLAYTSTDCVLHVQDLAGKKLLEVSRAYNPSWRQDGAFLLFEKVPAGRNPHYPETLHLARVDVATGKEELLTDGAFDDVRPEYHPSGKWILFVSGLRTGIASFWKLDAVGGQPEQLTNVGKQSVDKDFVPTPYRTTAWSADGRWFIYDFKAGDVMQTWGMQFTPQGKLVRTVKLADGLSPAWKENGKSLVYVRHTSAGGEVASEVLP
jgi:Tol biopolymer transport system component